MVTVIEVFHFEKASCPAYLLWSLLDFRAIHSQKYHLTPS